MKANRPAVLLAFGLILVAIGALWTLQGFGVAGGSAMSGSTLWAIVGPIVTVAGVYLLVRWHRLR